jgi:peptidoglycan/xylan/chitin deacetylase (PgdA/CDA1 family)
MLGRALRSIRIRLYPPSPKPLILMYHRIAAEPVDPWEIAVSPAHFKEHLDVLRRTRQPLALTEFVRCFNAGTLASNAVALTFDDGYADNLSVGKPHLAAAGLPATVFLATGYLGQPGEFWWDELARLILLQAGPRELEITVRGETMRFSLEEAAASPGTRWRAWLEPPRTGRQKAYMAFWSGLRTADVSERKTIMAGLRNAFAGGPEQTGSGRAMTLEEVRMLVSDGLMSIGPHTVTHPALTELDALTQVREIAASKKACEDLAGTGVGAFAYPFGSLDAEIKKAVAEAGFICACSTRHAPVTSSSDVFALPRIQVLDSGGDAFERSLRYASLAGGRRWRKRGPLRI